MRMTESFPNRNCRSYIRRSAVTCVLMLCTVYAGLYMRKDLLPDPEDANLDPGKAVNQRPPPPPKRDISPRSTAKSIHVNEFGSARNAIVEKYFNGTADDDPELVEYVRSRKILPPSKDPYNLTLPDVMDSSQFGQTFHLDKLLHEMNGGFFVEVGAYDGEKFSNSLFFERYRNWTGLLIEASPELFPKIQKKNRKAYSVNACLSLTPTAEIVRFLTQDAAGRIQPKGGKLGADIQCFPLYTLMLALGRSQIDLFSLDIEGDELKVLKTIPWDKMQIRLMIVEVNHIIEGPEAVMRYMASVGYTLMKVHKIDLIFAKKDLLDQTG